MARYYLSVQFTDSDNRFCNGFDTTFTKKEDIIHRAKVAYAENIKRWGKEDSEILTFEVFSFDRETEVELLVFRYEKPSNNETT